MLPSEYIRVSYFWPKSAKKSFCVWRVSKKLKKIEKNFEKILKFFFHKINSHYHIWIVPTSGVSQITLEGSRDQNLRGVHSPPPDKVRLNQQQTRSRSQRPNISQLRQMYSVLEYTQNKPILKDIQHSWKPAPSSMYWKDSQNISFERFSKF